MTRRSLSVLEENYYYRNQLGIYNNIIGWGTYSARVDEQSLKVALKRLIATENSLALNTKDGSLGPVHLIRFQNVVEFKEVALLDLDAELTNLHTIKFKMDSQQPLWRLVVINGRHLAFVTDHLICDGTSLARFHELLLAQLNSLSANNDTLHDDSETIQDDIVFDSSKTEVHFPGPWSKYVPWLPTPGLFVRALAGEYGPDWLNGMLNGTDFAGYPYNKKIYAGTAGIKASGQTLVKTIQIGINETQKLMDLAKKHGIKLTALLGYFGLRSMDPILDGKPCDMTFHIPINMRRYFDYDAIKAEDPHFSDNIWCLPSNVDMKVPCQAVETDSIDWSVVQAMDQSIHDKVSTSDPCRLWGMLKLVGAKQYLESSGGNLSSHTLELSNLGYYNLESSPLSLGELWFSQCCGVWGAAVDFNVVGTTSGLQIVLSYDSALPWASSVPDMAKTLVSQIQSAI